MAKQTERKEEIVICKECKKPEYWGKCGGLKAAAFAGDVTGHVGSI